MTDIHLPDFDDARPRWLAGLCPCCGSDICEWEWKGEVTEPEPIAEGVMICGRCIANDHMNAADDFVETMLAALVP